MNANEAIRFPIESGAHIAKQYIDDLTDAELLHRPAPKANHINWQLGHLIAAEHKMVSDALPGSMPPLPPGFVEKYAMDKVGVDDPKSLCTKAELMATFEAQRAATLAALGKASASDLEKPCEGWTPNVAAVFSGAAGVHWLMHVGQWAVVRRQLGRPPLF
jgi:hypothetical protein